MVLQLLRTTDGWIEIDGVNHYKSSIDKILYEWECSTIEEVYQEIFNYTFENDLEFPILPEKPYDDGYICSISLDDYWFKIK